MIWCGLDNGTGYAINKDNYTVAKPTIVLTDKKHSLIRRLTYDRSRDGVWSVGITAPNSKPETQITYMSSSVLTFQKSIFVPYKIATDIAVFGGIAWVAYEDGDIIGYHNVTGAVVRKYNLFEMNKPGVFIHLAAPLPDQMWISYGTDLRVLTSTAYINNSAEPEFVVRDITSVCKESRAISFLQPFRIPIQAGSASHSSGTSTTCEAVVTVDSLGAATIWNCSEMACEAWLSDKIDPINGELLSATGSSVTTSPTSKTYCFFAAASGSTLYTWSF